MTSFKGREFFACVAAEARPDRQSRALGVGHNCTAIESGMPAPLPFLCFAFSVAARTNQVEGFSPRLGTDAAGVGHNEDPRPYVEGTSGGRREHLPFRIVPEGGQVPENPAHPPNKDRCDVLHEDVSGS
jgi:hypothetical protein